MIDTLIVRTYHQISLSTGIVDVVRKASFGAFGFKKRTNNAWSKINYLQQK